MKLYANGVYQVGEHMKQRFNFVDIPTAKHITREVVDARRPLELLVAVPQDDCPSNILLYFDLNVDHTNATYEAIIECCKFMQQSGDYGMFIRMVQRHASMAYEKALAINKKVEDVLMKEDVNFESEGSIHYKHSMAFHKPYRRALEMRFKVVVAKSYQGDSTWLGTMAARGNGGETELVRVRDMRQAASKMRSNPSPAILNPAERVTQIGIAAHDLIFESLTNGLHDCTQLKTKLLVVQVQPGEFAEMAHTVMSKMLAQDKWDGCFAVCFKGIYIGLGAELLGDSPERAVYPVDGGHCYKPEHVPMSRVFVGRFLNEWWDTIFRSAGPRDAVVVNHDTVAKPELVICVWDGEVPVLFWCLPQPVQ